MELWKTININKDYEISTLGNVRITKNGECKYLNFYENHTKDYYKTINIDGKSVFDIDGMIYCQGSCLALENATIFDFIRFCQLENVSLEFTDYAIAMISKFKMKKMEFEEYMAFCEDEDSGDNFTIEVGYFNVLLSDTLLDKAVENAALKNSLVQMTGNHFEITNAGPTGRKSTEIRIQQQHGDLHPDAAEQLNDFNHG